MILNMLGILVQVKVILKIFEVVKEVQKLKILNSVLIRKKIHETAILKLESTKAKRKLNWSSKWKLSAALKKTIEWNRSIKKNISAENKCVQQFLTYINNE